MIESFYGVTGKQTPETKRLSKVVAFKQEKNRKLGGVEYAQANLVNITELMISTRPSYLIYQCSFGSKDCAKSWRTVRTIQGQCLKIDVNALPHYGSNGRLVSSLFRTYFGETRIL